MPDAPEIPYTVRRSDRARRVRVRVDAHDGVEVVLPARAREREAAAAVRELRPWIERRLREAAAVQARLAERAGTVPLPGQAPAPVPEPARARVHRRGNELLVPGGDAARDALERWYRRQARTVMAPKVQEAAAAV